MIWTPDDILTLQAMWARGHSATDIASELGTTRNSVVGKIHRLRGAKFEIARRGSGFRVDVKSDDPNEVLFPFVRRRRRTRLQIARAKALEAAEHATLKPDQSVCAVTFMHLDSMHCRWVLGEPHDQLYCGADQMAGSSYCYRHHAIAYTSPRNDGERKPWIEFRKRAA